MYYEVTTNLALDGGIDGPEVSQPIELGTDNAILVQIAIVSGYVGSGSLMVGWIASSAIRPGPSDATAYQTGLGCLGAGLTDQVTDHILGKARSVDAIPHLCSPPFLLLSRGSGGLGRRDLGLQDVGGTELSPRASRTCVVGGVRVGVCGRRGIP